jgi:hypothetical protein
MTNSVAEAPPNSNAGPGQIALQITFIIWVWMDGVHEYSAAGKDQGT